MEYPILLCVLEGSIKDVFTIKILYKISKQERIEKFIREVSFLKHNNHPTILRQYDEGRWNDRPFVETDYMTVTLEEIIKKNELSLGDKMLFSLQLLSAIKYLQSQNCLHRGIKPSNIFIKDNTAILGDFGLVKDISNNDIDDAADFKGYFAMPRSYRTPELVAYASSNVPLCFESDIFQLGLVLCELFTGKNPLADNDNPISPKAQSYTI